MKTMLIHQLLGSLATQLPVVLVCLIAGALLLSKWRQVPRAATWGALGFGLTLFLAIALPVAHVAVQHWLITSSSSPARFGPIFTVLAILSSVLHAACLAFLLVAVFADRPAAANSAGHPPTLGA